MSPEDFAEDLATRARGNWRKFESFGWHEMPEDAEEWAIVYTHHRDSDLLDQSNAAAIAEVLEAEEFEQDVRSESHNHWAVGWIDGFAIRVRGPDGNLTPAFKAYAALQAKLEDYPVLNAEDLSRREHEAGLEAIEAELRMLRVCSDHAGEVFSWLWDNNQGECENTDGRGACPSEDAVREACEALGILESEDDDSENEEP